MSALVNFVGFQIGWFSCVLNAAAGRPLIGMAIALLMVVLALWRTRHPPGALALLILAAALGTLCDSLFVISTRLQYRSGALPFPLPPPWDIALWPLFASTLDGALGWLQERLSLAALLGAIGGPLAYFGASRLGALQLLQPPSTLLLLAGAWSLLTPLLLALARRLSRRIPQPADLTRPHHA